MTNGETLYLISAVFGFVLFATVLGYETWRNNR